MTDALRLEGLSVWFGAGRDRIDAVRSVDMVVPAGASHGIVGESGSGKSTILRAITGLAPTWSGRIWADGKELGRTRDRTFYKTVQMVFQDPYASLHPRHSVDQVLDEALRLHGFKNRGPRVLKLLNDVGLSREFRFRFPHQLSGGQRQRVAIARALAPEPGILLLDEPTSALDVSVQAEILNLFADLRRDRGLTYVMVSHNLAVVAHLCERISVMKDGQTVETLSAASLRGLHAEHDYTRHLLQSALGYVR